MWQPEDARGLSWVRRNLYECEPEVTLDVVQSLVKYSACPHDTIQRLLQTPAMKKHLVPVALKLIRMKFDVLTTKQKAEEERKEQLQRHHAISQLARRYDREKIYNEIWSEAIQTVAKRYNLSDVGLAKVCRKLKIPRPGRGYWAKKAAGKVVPKQPPLPDLF